MYFIAYGLCNFQADTVGLTYGIPSSRLIEPQPLNVTLLFNHNLEMRVALYYFQATYGN